MRHMRILLLALFLLLGTGAVALADGNPGAPSTKGLTVTDNTQAAATAIWTDKAEYNTGDPVAVSFRAAFDGNATVYCETPDGRSSVLWPQAGTSGLVGAGRVYTMPAFNANGPAGGWKLSLVVVRNKPVQASNVSLLSILLQGLANQQPQQVEEKVTATAAFNVKPNVPKLTVRITGDSGARIFINGHDYGTAPLTAKLDIGRHYILAIEPGMLVQIRQITQKQSEAGLIEWEPIFRPIK